MRRAPFLASRLAKMTAAARMAGRNRADFHDLLRRYEIAAANFKE